MPAKLNGQNPTELYRFLSSFDRFMITLVVMSATLMQVIDTTIVNVALPHMQGSLSASSDEITWTLTSYLVSAAVCMPLTGYFADRFGRKKYLLFSIIGFTVVSALCGASVNLTEIVFFRLLQGLFGAGLVPLSQAILADIFPPEERGKAMAIWGIGVMVGPILGPTLGGYLIDIASWRWTFYVNVPVGLFTLLFSYVIPDTAKKNRSIDWTGLILLSLAIGSIQFAIDRGNQLDWFESSQICFAVYLSVTAFGGFLFHHIQQSSPQQRQSVFALSIFKDRHFALSSILLCIFGLGLYGIMAVQPLMMEGLFNYSALSTGLMMAPRGISGMLSMMLVGKLIGRVEPRWLIITGILISVSGMWIGTSYSLNISPFWFIFPMVLQGFGLGMVFVPLSAIAFSTLPSHLRTEAAGVFSLLRTIGSSIGISVTVTLLTRRSQLFWNELGGNIQPYNPALYRYFETLHLNPTQAQSAVLLSRELSQQASMMAFVNVFAFISFCFILMLPLAFILRQRKAEGTVVQAMIAD